ncbi:MAG: hypothetical protein CL388_03425 [Acidiferrobacteraceae bacterium]|nr:hypothetical protein [Acidiferrobacteraceae bacterium]MBT58753.1 hypothetical protein [Acidiferrobacteraceae bacterium]|tara:strand:- start:390 stop:878 length:489 start_codon:yes stop_codon:yes gene_type:complete
MSLMGVKKMAKSTPIDERLIAPCGMNCAICSNYLAYVNKLNRSQCAGCRTGNKRCTYLFEKCTGINHSLEGNAKARFCFECDQYPCKEINRMDCRYRQNYKVSIINNLEVIKGNGVGEFADEQYNKSACLKCGGLISVHNKKCFRCDKITKLVEKNGSEKSC